MSRPQYITIVLRYASADDVPRIGLATRDFGNFQQVASLQFGDAIEELSVVQESVDPDHWDFAQAALAKKRQRAALSGPGGK